MRFTRQSVAALSPARGKAYIIAWDNALPGFGVRVNEGGSRQWVVQYRVGGRTKRETIGRVDVLPLDEARKLARATLAKVHLGADPHAERAEARAKFSVTLSSVAARYLHRAEARLKPRSYIEVERHLTRHWKPLGDLPLHRIQRATVAARLGELLGRTALRRESRQGLALGPVHLGDGRGPRRHQPCDWDKQGD